MPPFTVVCNCRLSQAHIKLLRIHPNNLQLTIRQIFDSLIKSLFKFYLITS